MATSAPVEAAKKVEKVGAFYHIGVLPHSGKVALPVPGPDGKGVNKEESDASAYWNRSATVNGGKPFEDFKVFIPKNRKWLAIDLMGTHFPSTSQYVEATAEDVNRVTYAGGVVWLTPEKLSALVAATKRHYIRYPNGKDNADDLANISGAKMFSADDGAKPSGWTDAEWSEFKRTNQGKYQTETEVNEDTDAPVADYVYITKLDGAKVDKANLKDYNRDPKKYHAAMVRPLSAEFFSNPPKSVSETYPGA